MNIIGFDFGTTNSMLSYYNPETKELDCFTPNASASSYIPTVIAYKGDDVIIGTLAKNNITKKGYDAYEHFKLRLGRDADKVIENRSKSPLQVTTDYIKKILAQYQDVQNISHIDGIVMTVPETWFREASNRTARENIEGIYASLGYDTETQFQLESEPVAATAYFCHNYERSAGKKYDGHITVVDYGGGTLDVTLCKVDNGGSIKILERCGFGEFNSTNGCAGIAFDEAVTELLCKRNEMDIEKTDRRFIKLRDLFEKELIDNTETVCSMMVRYYKSPAIVEDTPIFTIEYNDDEIDVFCEDLDVCFQKVNAPMLDKSLAQMKEYFAVHGVDSTSQNDFKVLLVGGFSNFYCVENTVRNFFGSRTGLSDKRFDTCFSDNNKSFAIAKGAALIAQKAIHIDHTCTHDIGFMVVRPDENDRWVDADIKIIKKGMKLSEAKTPIFAPNKVQVKVKSGAFRIFMDDGRENGAGRIQAALDQSVGELFPNMDKANNTYQIGFSVDKNLIPTVHIKDASGTVNSVSLNKLLERISLCEVKEEK